MHAVSQWEALCAFLEYEVILAFLFPPQASRLFGDMREEGTTVRVYILLLKKAFLNGVILLVLGLAVQINTLESLDDRFHVLLKETKI